MNSELFNEKYKIDSMSGGQKKKVGIIKAVLGTPEILILDEIFVGLDPFSLYQTQKALKKYLPNTKIIVVDHYAQYNNFEGFYDYCINIFPKVVKEIKLKPVKNLPVEEKA